MAKKKLPHLVNIEDEQFPSNSKASQQVAPIRQEVLADMQDREEVEQEKVINRPKAIRRRKSITRSIKQTFFSEDTKNVFQYVVMEVLVPAAKSMIQDMVTQGIEMFLFGEGGSSRKRRDRGEKSMVSYSKMYDRGEDRRYATSRHDRFGLEDIFFADGEEASDVLRDMCDTLEKYDQLSVADYFDMAGIDGATHAHAKWGWTSLKRAKCTHTRNGWAIILPNPEELE
jgi:hypothetical protein